MNIFNNKLSKTVISAVFILAVGVTTTASATVALSNSTALGNQLYGGTLGQFFDVTAPTIVVNGLGVYDSGLFGVAGPLHVKIWKSDGTTMTPTVVFGTIAGQGTPIGNYQFKSIAPVVLTTGKYIVGAWGFLADFNGNASLPPPTPSITGDTGGGLVTYSPGDLGTYSIVGGAFPTLSGGVISNFQFAAGNFQFSVPEPETYLLMGSLLGAIMFLAYKKKHAKV